MSAPSLFYAVRPLAPEDFERLRHQAHESGRLIERDELTVLGFGEALLVELPGGLGDRDGLEAAVGSLSSIEPFAEAPRHALSGALPLALGALPFDRRASGTLVVPEVTVVSSPGREPQALLVGVPGRIGELLRAPAGGLGGHMTTQGALAPPDDFRLASARPHQDFLDRVRAALAEIGSGRLDKVVLAREVSVQANRPLRQADLVGRLRALHPSCATFAIDGFIGATPELLVRRQGAAVASHPLAGTAARSGDPESDRRAEAALLASAKERSEHRAVVEAIVAALAPVLERLEVPDGPTVVELRNVSHLGTSVTGTLARKDGAFPSALDLVGLLHPTPAVAGSPVELALEYLAKLEELDRERYAGPVGWVDASGDGEWHVGIRSAIVAGSSARLFAGVGIVADSDPAAELAETQLKLQAFLAAAVRP
jgi:menaquinone-specific isochorismate synthase